MWPVCPDNIRNISTLFALHVLQVHAAFWHLSGVNTVTIFVLGFFIDFSKEMDVIECINGK